MSRTECNPRDKKRAFPAENRLFIGHEGAWQVLPGKEIKTCHCLRNGGTNG